MPRRDVVPAYALILPVMRWVGKAPAVTLISPAELRAALADAGFVDVEAPEVGEGPRGLFLVARKPADQCSGP